ncbi:tetratricopeptide repeat protein [Desulfobacter vibrioformis]|uniref:tetratricopeptide repeat protein n=1 Tax=Desulfobacter vibrioformis TaxID=34031 RepID=UPI0005513D6F|nr:hypothetical protein [Desulfobacter vibrioformis]
MVIILVAGFLFCSITLDKKYPCFSYEDLSYLPSGKFLKGAALGYDEILGDLLWIKALGYFGRHSATDQNYTWLGHILDIVTTLDPLYQPPYEFGGIVLAADAGDVDSSIALLKKGMEHVPSNHPRYYYLPFFLAFDYMYYKRDYLTAARYLELAAKFPQSPPYLPNLVARLYADADSPEVAVPFLQEMIQSTENPDLKARLIVRLHQVRHEAILKRLNQAIELFYLKFKKYPSALNDLADTGMIPEIPVDPRGGTYYIAGQGRFVKNTLLAGELKVHIKKEKTPRQDDLPLPMRVPQYD